MTRLHGCITALVTPFTAAGALDEPALRALVEWQIASGVHGLVPVGSTGEAVTLTLEEKVRVVSITAEVAAGRVPVIAGAGSNDTATAIAWSHAMVEAGATHLLHVSPMYNKPPQRGIIAHFRAVADAARVPIVVYNVPGRTGSNVEAATQLAIAEHTNVCAVKEASGSLPQISEILRHRPARLSVLAGDDPLTQAVMAAGGDGVISVVSNALPAPMARLTEACARGDQPTAAALHLALTPFFSAAFIEANPIPVKAALAMRGRIGNVLRLPLVPMDPKHEAVLRDALEAGARA